MAAILTTNSSSSSMRFAVYEAGETPRRQLDGKIDRIGLSGTNLIVNDPAGNPQSPRRLAAADHRTAVDFLLEWIGRRLLLATASLSVFGYDHDLNEPVIHAWNGRPTSVAVAQ